MKLLVAYTCVHFKIPSTHTHTDIIQMHMQFMSLVHSQMADYQCQSTADSTLCHFHILGAPLGITDSVHTIDRLLVYLT